jgi:hypothetical protein
LNEAHSRLLAHVLTAPDTTRRQAITGLLAAAAFIGLDTVSEAKKKGHKRRNRKNKNKDDSKKNDTNNNSNSGTGTGNDDDENPPPPPTDPEPDPDDQMPNKAHVAVGVYIPWALDDPAVLTDFHQAIGRSLDFVIWYEHWTMGNFDNGSRQYLATLDQWNMTPVISWNPFDAHGHPVDQPAFRLATITSGAHNDYIDSWIAGLKAYDKPVYIKFAHEMNGNWTPWGYGVNGNQPGDFIQAWRYIHNRFTNAGVTNVRWIWNPNIATNGIAATLAQVYPGDAYVDWVGMNGYNWGTSVYWVSCPCQSRWDSFSHVFDRTYGQLVALSDKPIFIGEFASSEDGGNKAKWISDGLLEQLPNKYPRVKAISWFSKKATGLDTNANGQVQPTAEVDWRITSSDTARQAFADAVRHTYYQATLR